MRYNLHWNTSSTRSDQMVRLMVFVDNNDNDGTPPTASQVLQSTASLTAITSPLNKDNSRRFTILLDKIYVMDTNKREQVVNKFITIPMKKDIHGVPTIGHHITWDTSDFTESGHIYTLIVSSDNTFQPNFDYYYRVNFMDN